MLLLKVVPVVLPLFLVGAGAQARFDLRKLLQKVIEENVSAAVYFIGIDDSFITNFMRTRPDIDVTIFKALPTDYNEGFFQKSAILVVQALDEDGESRDELQTFIEHLRSRDFVVIVASELDNLYHSLSFCHENKFKRIFGSLNDSSYAYLPYADRPLQLLTRSDEPLPDALRDLNGFAFRTTIQTDLPSCFWYLDPQGRYQIGGYAAQTLLQFLRRHNATFQEVLINNSRERNLPGVVNATLNGLIDISMTSYSAAKVLDNSWPIKINSWCIMIPVLEYMDSQQSFLKPFSPTVWGCIALALVYMVVMDFVKDICIGATPSWWRSFKRTYLVMLNEPGVPARAAYRFHGQVLLFGFIMSNLYIIYCTSFLTTFIKAKHYETIQDLIDNHVPLVIPSNELDMLKEVGNNDLDPIAFPVDYMVHARGSYDFMSPSLASTVDEDDVNFLIQMRNQRNRLQIHILTENLHLAFKTFTMPRHSPFKTILDVLIEDVIASGLVLKWDRNVLVQAELSEGFDNYDPEDLLPELPTPMGLDVLLVAWVCLLVGPTLATVVFLCELFIARVYHWRGARVTQA